MRQTNETFSNKRWWWGQAYIHQSYDGDIFTLLLLHHKVHYSVCILSQWPQFLSGTTIMNFGQLGHVYTILSALIQSCKVLNILFLSRLLLLLLLSLFCYYWESINSWESINKNAFSLVDTYMLTKSRYFPLLCSNLPLWLQNVKCEKNPSLPGWWLQLEFAVSSISNNSSASPSTIIATIVEDDDGGEEEDDDEQGTYFAMVMLLIVIWGMVGIKMYMQSTLF